MAHEAVPARLAEFPTFRNHADPKASATDGDWSLWDGTREWRVDRLTPEQQRFPKEGIVNDTALIEMAEGSWGPDEEL